MRLKDKYTWLKHLDFILIDLLCLIIAFFVAYYIRFGNINIFVEPEWSALLNIICCMNLFYAILNSTYSGILKRRYYQQFQREIKLFISQIATICIAFYVFRIGIRFSRSMMFTMYFLYFVTSQPLKYIRKKVVAKEFSFSKKEVEKEKIEINRTNLELENIETRSKIRIAISKFVKRFIDIIGGLVGCIILIPLTIIVFILNKLNEEDDGPVFFIQERIGQNGKPFKMFKFRSMVVDADEKLERFLEENEDVRNEFFVYRKIKNDPRVTKIGKFLRKTSLDEFPQFINVLLGDMSIVGPRPYLDRERKSMGNYYNIITKYKPGITGLWQISGRSDVSFDDRLELDITYHKNHSLIKDIKILLKTIGRVMKKNGAM